MALVDTGSRAPAPHAHQLLGMSAREITRLIASGELSSAEAVEFFVARLKAVNSTLNAVTVDLSESARKAAAEVDKTLAKKIPEAVKFRGGFNPQPPHLPAACSRLAHAARPVFERGSDYRRC